MKLRRCLVASAAPVALAVGCAGPALAAVPPVSVRVEGPSRTLLETKTVTAPSAGSITLGGTPKDACPADSAAGALRAAVHGRWGGSYYKGLGIELSTILGTRLSYSKGSYWGFYVNDRFAAKGVCDTKLTRGESLLFAPVPAKGKAPRPLVVKAPERVTAGEPFTIRTFVYPGASKATRPVSGVTLAATEHGAKAKGTVDRGQSSAKGALRVSYSKPGTVRLVASAKHTIRSAAVTIKVTK